MAPFPPPSRRRPSTSSTATKTSSFRAPRLKTTASSSSPALPSLSHVTAQPSTTSTSSTSALLSPSEASTSRPSHLPNDRTLSYTSQEAMKRALERDDEGVAARERAREVARQAKGKGKAVAVPVTSEFGGEGGGEEGMFLGKRRSPEGMGAAKLKEETDIKNDEDVDIKLTPPPVPPSVQLPPPPQPTPELLQSTDEVDPSKRTKLRHPNGLRASSGGRPSTWFGWGGPPTDNFISSQPHPRQSSTPDVFSQVVPVLETASSPAAQDPLSPQQPLPASSPLPVADPFSSNHSDSPPASSSSPATLPTHDLAPNSHTFLPGLGPTLPSHSLALPYPQERSSWLRRIPIPLPSRIYYSGEVETPVDGLTPVGEIPREDRSGSARPTTAGSEKGKENEGPGGGGSWFFRSAASTTNGKVASPPPAEEPAALPPSAEVKVVAPVSLPHGDGISPSLPPSPTPAPSRLGWLSRATSTSTLRPSAVDAPFPPKAPPGRPFSPPPPPSLKSYLPTTLSAPDASLTPPPATSSWFRRTPSSSSLSSKPTGQAPAPAQPSCSPTSTVNFTSSSTSIPIPRKASLSSTPSASSSYSSTRPIVPSSLGREVVIAGLEEGTQEDAPADGRAGGWWGYVPVFGPSANGGAAGSRRKEVVSMVQEEVDAVAIPEIAKLEVVKAPAAAETEGEGLAPPPPTTSYLRNPISWVWPVATLPTLPASASPSLVNEPPTEAPLSPPTPLEPSTTLIVASTSAAQPPTSYSSWLSFIASKAIAPPTFAKPASTSDQMEVMDIDEEADPSASSSSLVVPGTNSSPPQSIRRKNSSSSLRVSSSPITPTSLSNSLAVSSSSSPSPSHPLTTFNKVHRSGSASTLKPPPPPNLVLPSFNDIFRRSPRSIPPPKSQSLAKKTLSTLLSYSSQQPPRSSTAEGTETKLEAARRRGRELPKEWAVVGGRPLGTAVTGAATSNELRRIVILGIHGWYPNAIIRYVAGEPTGTSIAFVKKMEEAVRRYLGEASWAGLEKVTLMPLEGEGKVEDRVDKLFKGYLSRPEWVDDLRMADVVFVATHSQGCPVSTHLLNRLYEQGHLRSPRNEEAVQRLEFAFGHPSIPRKKGAPLARVVMLGICGVHVGPLTYLHSHSVVGNYLQFFEGAAAHELFEFQDTESTVSRAYSFSLSQALDHGVKFVYVASLNDQVVPVYGAIFSPVSHPSILRVLHIDGAAYSASDFVTNLLIFCLQLRNAGLSDGGMVAHLSEVVASGLTGIGHSTAYGEDQSYDLAVRYLFETTPSKAAPGTLEVEEFLATEAKNSYEIPWILRGIMEDPLVLELFGRELEVLRKGFEEWNPTTAKMRDLRRKLEPLRPRQSRRTLNATTQQLPAVRDLSRIEGGALAPKL